MIVELKVNPTEDREVLTNILSLFIKNKIKNDKRADGEYIYTQGKEKSNLLRIKNLLAENQLVDIAKKRLEKNTQYETLTSLYFNRQAASVGKVAIIDLEDNIPLGPILLQIVSKDKDGLMNIIKFLTETNNPNEGMLSKLV